MPEETDVLDRRLSPETGKKLARMFFELAADGVTFALHRVIDDGLGNIEGGIAIETAENPKVPMGMAMVSGNPGTVASTDLYESEPTKVDWNKYRRSTPLKSSRSTFYAEQIKSYHQRKAASRKRNKAQRQARKMQRQHRR